MASFDFGTDDVLCSYEEYTPPVDHTASPKDLHESRVVRPLVNVCGEQDEFLREEVLSAIEKGMAKYADKLIKHLEGISGRLTQLELCCYKLERSVGEFRADMIRDQSEADLRMKSLVKRIHEVHRSVQIIRDKQELYETHKELANLQVSPKESTHSPNSQKSTEGFKASATPENEAHSNGNNLQSLPHEPVRHVLNQAISYHTHHQSLNPKPEPHYTPQGALMLDLSAHPQFKQQLNAAPNQPAHQLPSFPQYHQQWPQPAYPQPEAYHVSLAHLQPIKPGFLGSEGYPSHPSMQAYNAVYVIDGSRASQLQSFPNGNHIYGDMMEKKAVNMP
ncbi:hypothetical protein HPP92_009474 [Vanilla planifolia]|uniref:Uncharacterized protein n=1 Tax=Vanilla planifolia TaxID=51239 RepID=A0A835REC2_VANPL|nr:hypothetical protein HPP92_009474 [Vanilla planifolia]